MRILTYSRAFLPMVGGLELNVHQLCSAFSRQGHDVVVVTTTPGEDDPRSGYTTVRRPSAAAMVTWVRWCDVFHQANVSLRGWWPLLLVRRPWVASHHSWYRRPDGRLAWQDRLKRWLLRYADGSIAVSRAVAADLGGRGVVIENAYRDDLFRVLPGISRDRGLVFVGRLVSDKGVDVLLDALARLAALGERPDLTIVGDGPDRATLAEQAERLGVATQVMFAGTVVGEDLVAILNRHRILVVPSRYDEPFGIVALEGIACGCVVVGSRGGGLADAIGPCGVTFANGDVEGLATALAGLLREPTRLPALLAGAATHLAAHRNDGVAARYLEVFARAVRRRNKARETEA